MLPLRPYRSVGTGRRNSMQTPANISEVRADCLRIRTWMDSATLLRSDRWLGQPERNVGIGKVATNAANLGTVDLFAVVAHDMTVADATTAAAAIPKRRQRDGIGSPGAAFRKLNSSA